MRKRNPLALCMAVIFSVFLTTTGAFAMGKPTIVSPMVSYGAPVALLAGAVVKKVVFYYYNECGATDHTTIQLRGGRYNSYNAREVMATCSAFTDAGNVAGSYCSYVATISMRTFRVPRILFMC